MKRLLIVLVTFCSWSIWAQENEAFLDKTEIDALVKKHEKHIRDLYNVRGAPQTWIKTDNFDFNTLRTVLKRYDNPIGILVYTYYDNHLHLDLFNNDQYYSNHRSHKTKIDSKTLQKHINNTNNLFSSSFLNRAPKLRGAEGNSSNSNGNEEDSYNVLNKILLPKELKLHRFEHLIIVPTFNIATLPFGAFKLNTGVNEYLIDKMSYSIAPNLFELLHSSDKNFEKHGKIYDLYYFWDNALFVANPKYPKNLKWDFPNLPGAEQEVDSIIQMSKPKSFKRLSDKEATKKNVLKSICEYDLLYFATHGISNSEQPMDHSFLVLADDGSDKSYLTLREIMNTRHKCTLKADLVVLSACQTGLGKSHKGGIIGLARAFQIAGAQHVLMSLWNISDSETATIMQFFFNELEKAKELMPHEALRNAILKYKNEINDDPKYWAAFSVFGVPY